MRKFQIAFLTPALGFLAGCATLSQNPAPVQSGALPATQSSPVLQDTAATPGDLTDSGADLKAIPLAVNRQVLQWIDYFQGQGRPHMERYLSRSTRYMPVMKAILRKQGLPEDLIYIALIESGFSSAAKSTASAVGYWQFIRGTGRRYGLRVDSYVDERRDFIKSTEAAAAYFKGLYDIFGVWYLAIASYNVGENRVKNVVLKYHTHDFWQLARENKLPEETSNYVPKFIAARLIAKAPEKYGFTDIDFMPPLEFSEVQFTGSIDLRKLAKEMQIDYDDLRDLNPSYKRGVAFERGGKLTLRVPKGFEAKATQFAQNAVPEAKAAYVADEDYSYYKVRRGDTIAVIAKKFGTSQRNIRVLNKLKLGTRLASGRRLRVPAETIGGLSKQGEVENTEPKANKKANQNATTNNGPAAPAMSIGMKKTALLTALNHDAQKPLVLAKRNLERVHIVRRGDTLIEIARQYQVSLGRLATHNRLSHRAKIVVGTRLEIP